MRSFLTLTVIAVLATPAAIGAQTLAPPSSPPPEPTLAPVAGFEPTTDVPPAIAAPPPPNAEGVAAPELEAPTDAAPVLVEAPEQKGKIGRTVGTVAGGMVGGVAGAAVLGPVGKFAGGFLGKRLVKGLFGDGRPDIPQVTEADPADQAATNASSRAAAPAPAQTTAEQ